MPYEGGREGDASLTRGMANPGALHAQLGCYTSLLGLLDPLQCVQASLLQEENALSRPKAMCAGAAEPDAALEVCLGGHPGCCRP